MAAAVEAPRGNGVDSSGDDDGGGRAVEASFRVRSPEMHHRSVGSGTGETGAAGSSRTVPSRAGRTRNRTTTRPNSGGCGWGSDGPLKR